MGPQGAGGGEEGSGEARAARRPAPLDGGAPEAAPEQWFTTALELAHSDMRAHLRPQDVRQRVSEAIRGRVHSAEIGLADELQAIRKDDVSDLSAALRQQVQLLRQDLEAHREEPGLAGGHAEDCPAALRATRAPKAAPQGAPARRRRGPRRRGAEPVASGALRGELLDQMVQRCVGTRRGGSTTATTGGVTSGAG
ncbi:unnamed protein product [Prorocentrum cordatum]|uniref:Uncharacterized protein n=1 Tax=Prorocentrum cordatum TaxID=2364126 RepID=A0ABN9TYD5_9DINO|nr:unnamed protein product [Polarella glacialis]